MVALGGVALEHQVIFGSIPWVIARQTFLGDAEIVIVRGIQRLTRQPVSAAELSKVKTQLLTDTLLTRQTPEGLGAAVAEAAVLEGGAAQVNAGLAALLNVTAADVQRVLRRHLVGSHKVTIEYKQDGAPR